MQGSSAIQTVAALQPRVAHLTNYVRGQTWIAVPGQINVVAQLLGRKEGPKDTEEDRAYDYVPLHALLLTTPVSYVYSRGDRTF